jgi:hypothetical protein
MSTLGTNHADSAQQAKAPPGYVAYFFELRTKHIPLSRKQRRLVQHVNCSHFDQYILGIPNYFDARIVAC